MKFQLPEINDLPYDIFRQIIVYAYTYTPRPHQRDEDFSHIQALAPPFSASHVCRAWRYALLSDKTMWSTISIPEMKPRGVKELIHRSESAPLHVSLFMEENRMRYYNMSNALSLIFAHIKRFKSLRVYVQFTYPLLWSSERRVAPIRQLLLFLQQPAPSLQVFSFRNIGAEYFFQPMFLKTLFSGFAPNLKHINYQVSSTTYQGLSCPLFNGLSELHLSCFENTNLESVLALLKLSSSLEVLGIYIDWPWVTHKSPSDRSESVNLPHLRRLVLQASNPTQIINFVNGYLTFPPNSVKWDISVLADHLFQDSPPLLEPIPQVRFTNLHVLFKSPYMIPDDKTALTIFDQIDGNKLTFSFHDTSFLTGIQWCDLPMMHSIDFSSVTHFNLELISQETLPFKKLFSTIFSVMENLQYLVVKQVGIFRSDPKDQASLQGLSTLISPTQDGAKPLCPLLRQITVKLEDPFHRSCATMLQVCSAAQRESGCPLLVWVYCPEGWQSGVKSELQLEGDIPASPFVRSMETSGYGS